MPTYEYSCPKCGIFEVAQRITEDAYKACPKCGSPVERLISTTSFQLKGGGWYKTDYAASSSQSKATPDHAKQNESKAEPVKSESSTSTSTTESTPTATSEK